MNKPDGNEFGPRSKPIQPPLVQHFNVAYDVCGTGCLGDPKTWNGIINVVDTPHRYEATATPNLLLHFLSSRFFNLGLKAFAHSVHKKSTPPVKFCDNSPSTTPQRRHFLFNPAIGSIFTTEFN